MTSVAYQTRLFGADSTKVMSGSFGGPLNIDTANRLISNHGYSAIVKPSGTLTLVDKAGREVWLYFRVDPAQTVVGNTARLADNELRRKAAEIENRKREEVESLLDSMSADEALRRLTGNV
jgi:hypothetical protein